jgi:hypothetical protein
MVNVGREKRSGHVGELAGNPDVFMNGALAPVPATSLVAVANLVEDAITARH